MKNFKIYKTFILDLEEDEQKTDYLSGSEVVCQGTYVFKDEEKQQICFSIEECTKRKIFFLQRAFINSKKNFAGNFKDKKKNAYLDLREEHKFRKLFPEENPFDTPKSYDHIVKSLYPGVKISNSFRHSFGTPTGEIDLSEWIEGATNVIASLKEYDICIDLRIKVSNISLKEIVTINLEDLITREDFELITYNPNLKSLEVIYD